MTIKEIMAYVDDIKPNAFSNRQKTIWLNEVDGMVQTDVMLLQPSTVVTYVYEAAWSGTGIAFPDSATMVFPTSPQFRAGGTVTITGLLDYADNHRTDVKIKSISADGKTLCFEEGTFTAWGERAETATATVTFDGSNSEPLIAPPHHKIYYTYLMAMIDFANGEYGKYQNTMTLFNSFFGSFNKWYVENYQPGDGKCIEKGYYLSAYAIAVKHGFCGTEEDFLSSLKGEKGDVGKGEKGDVGNGIRGVAKSGGTGAPGTTDTYTITMTDGTTSTFTVYNGKEQDISGKADKVPATNLLTNGDFSNGTVGWLNNNSTNTVSNGVLSNIGNGTIHYPYVTQLLTIKADDKYYVRQKVRLTNSDCVSIDLKLDNGIKYKTITSPIANIWNDYSAVVTATSTSGTFRIHHVYADSATANGKEMQLTNPIVINLTATFGAGNEPTAAGMDALLSAFPNSWFDGTQELLPIKTLYNAKANKAQEAWITPTLLNSWTQADATNMPVRYRKDEFGIVHLFGRLSGGTAGTVAFTLPVGYRPSKRVGFACYTSSGTHGKAYALATGEVYIYEFNSYIQIDSISFFVD